MWEELSARYPGFAFPHGHGLGVLAVGREVNTAFRDFVEAAGREPLVARFFAALGDRIAAPAQERRARAAVEAEAARAIREAEEARAAAERKADQAFAADAELRAELADVRTERSRLEVQLRAREADLTGVVRSASWRVTAPLRGG